MKRGKGSDDKPSKKFKDSSGKGASFINRPKSKITQVRNLQTMLRGCFSGLYFKILSEIIILSGLQIT